MFYSLHDYYRRSLICRFWMIVACSDDIIVTVLVVPWFVSLLCRRRKSRLIVTCIILLSPATLLYDPFGRSVAYSFVYICGRYPDESQSFADERNTGFPPPTKQCRMPGVVGNQLQQSQVFVAHFRTPWSFVSRTVSVATLWKRSNIPTAVWRTSSYHYTDTHLQNSTPSVVSTRLP